MFRAIGDFIQRLGRDRVEFGEKDPRVAAVALMYYLMDADGDRKKDEHQKLAEMLAQQYDMASHELKQLREAGEAAYKNSTDLFGFTNVIKQDLNEDERVTFIRLLWDLAYADGHVYELEDNIIWRIAEKLGVDRDDRLKQKREAAVEQRDEQQDALPS